MLQKISQFILMKKLKFIIIFLFESMNIYAGTYNGQLYMISGNPTNIQLKRKNQISETSIRCLHLPSGSPELLSGGFDGELVAINKYNLQSTKQTKEAKGMINCIQKASESTVALGLETGLIRFWDWKSWNLKKQVREHKKPIRSFYIDNKQVLFFSAANNSLILWNTQKHQKAFHYKFDYEIDHVLIDESLEFTFLINQKQARQIKTQNNEEVALLKINSAQTIQSAILFQKFLIIGGDKGNIFVYSFGCYDHKISFQAHKLRVKSMKIIKIDDMHFLITASSNGQIAVWDVLQFLKQIDNIGQDYDLQGLKPLSSVSLDRRVICIEVSLIQNNQDNIRRDQKKEQKNEIKTNEKNTGRKKEIKSGKKLTNEINKGAKEKSQDQKSKEWSNEDKTKRIQKKKQMIQKKKKNLNIIRQEPKR